MDVPKTLGNRAPGNGMSFKCPSAHRSGNTRPGWGCFLCQSPSFPELSFSRASLLKADLLTQVYILTRSPADPNTRSSVRSTALEDEVHVFYYATRILDKQVLSSPAHLSTGCLLNIPRPPVPPAQPWPLECCPPLGSAE